ncbi:MAG: NAD(P)H-dependent glycerol-3-phosphate dehydrogenase [Bacteroidota bacterium]
MSSESTHMVGVIGAGSFGTAVASLLAEKVPVMLYARRVEVIDRISKNRQHKGWELPENVKLTSSLSELAGACELIFPIVPSEDFLVMIRELSPFLKPNHKMIHGTKGLAVELSDEEEFATLERIEKSRVKTISELIREETVVRRIGCISGPNLASEIAQGQPAATVVASPYEEVIREGMAALRHSRLRVHASHDLLGIELAGVLKNIMAIASGIVSGLDYGDNTKALLISRGLAEVVNVGKGLGADPRAFLGIAGVGDLVATCYSKYSRNYTVGFRLAKGESLEEIIADMEEVAEGVKTTAVVHALAQTYGISAPITAVVHRILFKNLETSRGVNLLMEYPFTEDVEFI